MKLFEALLLQNEKSNDESIEYGVQISNDISSNIPLLLPSYVDEMHSLKIVPIMPDASSFIYTQALKDDNRAYIKFFVPTGYGITVVSSTNCNLILSGITNTYGREYEVILRDTMCSLKLLVSL